KLHDPRGIESAPGTSTGFGLLEFETTLHEQKTLTNVSGRLLLSNTAVSGYEIHAGVTRGPALQRPLIKLADRHDGVVSDDGQIIGTYLHGIFEKGEALQAILAWAGYRTEQRFDHQQQREQALDKLADVFEQQLDLSSLGLVESKQVNVTD
ncbi:MAG: cobyric acid synthase CobQ, partial [Thioalkalispiraceae bacterium]